MKWFLLILFNFGYWLSFCQPLNSFQPLRFLALGDSYTIGQSVAEEHRWPNQLAKALGNYGYQIEAVDIIARTGWRTDDLIRGIEEALPDSNYNLVSLLIGVNNQYQGTSFDVYPDEFERLLRQAIALCSGNKTGVFVLSIPDYGYTPYGSSGRETISSEIDKYNQSNKAITEQMDVTYINITPISREGIEKPEYVANDGLHPSGEMYAQWTELLINELIPVLNSTNDNNMETKRSVAVSVSFNDKQVEFNSNYSIDAITLFDITGRPALKLKANGAKILYIDASLLNPGIYVYRVLTKLNQPATGKIIIR